MKQKTLRQFSDSVADFRDALTARIKYLKQEKFNDEERFPKAKVSLEKLQAFKLQL